MKKNFFLSIINNLLNCRNNKNNLVYINYYCNLCNNFTEMAQINIKNYDFRI